MHLLKCQRYILFCLTCADSLWSKDKGMKGNHRQKSYRSEVCVMQCVLYLMKLFLCAFLLVSENANFETKIIFFSFAKFIFHFADSLEIGWYLKI